MAHVERRSQGGKVAWRARYRAPDGKERSKTFAKKSDAERWLNGVEVSKQRNEWVDPQAGRVTVRTFAEGWLAQQVHRPSTAYSTEIRLRAHVVRAFGDREMASIRPSDVRSWVAQLNQTHAPSYVTGLLRLLSGVFNAAVEDRIVTHNPCKAVRPPRADNGRIDPLRPEQVASLHDAMQPNLKAAVVVTAGLGLRMGELSGLTVDRVDWLRRTVRVDRQLVTLAGRGVSFGPPKTASSVRSVPAPSLVLEALTAHLQAYGEGPDRLIFTTTTSKPIRRNVMFEAWDRARTRAAIETRGWHDLRHFYASALIHAGESVKVVQNRLGHNSAVETLDTYGHLWPDNEEATRSAVEGVLGAALMMSPRSSNAS